MVKTIVQIEGMMCGMCEAHINDVIRRNFDVKSVKSSRHKKTSEIVSENSIPADKLKEVILQTGYTVLGVSEEEYKKKGLFG